MSTPAPLDEGLRQIIDILHPQVQREVRPRGNHIEEIILDLERPLAIKTAEGYHYGVEITREHHQYTIGNLDAFRDDGRTGIEGTLHRISVIRDRYDAITGMTVRIGRPVIGVAEPLRPYLENLKGLVVIGPPAVGKTTLLRDIVRILASIYGPKVVVIDTSNEIGGDGKVPHRVIGVARRIQVPSTDRQAEMIRQGLANHGPEVIVVDEIGYHGDVAVVETTGRRGVRVVATCHGESLMDLVNNPVFWPLLGHVNVQGDTRRRIGRPAFGVAVEVHGKGKMVVHLDLGRSVDCLFSGEVIGDEGLEYIGDWPGITT